jgi:hypothetical protein
VQCCLFHDSADSGALLFADGTRNWWFTPAGLIKGDPSPTSRHKFLECNTNPSIGSPVPDHWPNVPFSGISLNFLIRVADPIESDQFIFSSGWVHP